MLYDYRVLIKKSATDMTTYNIHKVYYDYDSNNILVPISYDHEPVTFNSFSVAELAAKLDFYKLALTKPLLDSSENFLNI